MKSIACLVFAILAFTTTSFAKTPGNDSGEKKTIFSKSHFFNLFLCTVTRSQEVTLTGTDCDGQNVVVTTTGTATATAETCAEANAKAYLNAGYAGYVEASAALLLISWDCQGPPEP